MLDEERDRAAIDRCGRELVPVDPRADHAAEERSRGRGAMVVDDVGDGDGRVVDDLEHLGRIQEVVQQHGFLYLYGAGADTLPAVNRSPSCMIWENTGAATAPPWISVAGSSSTTMPTRRGDSAGTKPAKLAM